MQTFYSVAEVCISANIATTITVETATMAAITLHPEKLTFMFTASIVTCVQTK